MMQSLKYIPLICLLFLGCTKEEDKNEPHCKSQPCSGYLNTWEELIKEQNHISSSYFQDHFRVISSKIIQHQNGEQFVVRYLISIEWLEVELKDAFMVKISENKNVYPGMHLNRGKYLDLDEIQAIIRFGNLDSELNEIEAVNHLSFSSADDALTAIRHKAKTNDMFYDHVGYKKSHGGYRANGHPYLFSVGKEDPISKTRLDAEIDLVNKNISTYPTITEKKTAAPLEP